MLFKERLINLRAKKGASQDEIAEHLNIAQNTYSGYEKGRCEPGISTLIRLANYFNVTIDYLLGYSDIEGDAHKILSDLYLYFKDKKD